MDNNYILRKLEEIINERGWTYYRFSREVDLPLSTVRNLFTKTIQPSFNTLSKICDGLGISLSQFFNDNNDIVSLSDDEKDILLIYYHLDSIQKRLAKSYLQGLFDANKKEGI